LTGIRATEVTTSFQSGSTTQTEQPPQLLEQSGGVPADPFLGIAVAGGDAFIRKQRPQSFEIAWKNRASSIQVKHCVTQEGLRVDITSASASYQYYLPLDMDAEVPARDRCSD
jgi:hypothetical protein